MLFYRYFEDYSCPNFPSPGDIATETIIFKRGLPKELQKFQSSMEEQFRNIGLKLKLDNSKWYLLEDFTVCKKDEKISPEQAKLLRILDKRVEEFKIKITAYNNKVGEYVLVDAVGFSKSGNENTTEDENMDLNDYNQEFVIS